MLRDEVTLTRRGTSRLHPAPVGRVFPFRASLTIHYRLLLVPSNPANGAERGTVEWDNMVATVLRWPSGRFELFRDAYDRQVIDLWDDAFWLVGSFANGVNAPREHPCIVRCRL